MPALLSNIRVLQTGKLIVKEFGKVYIWFRVLCIRV
jgi:hypothetical protein